MFSIRFQCYFVFRLDQFLLLTAFCISRLSVHTLLIIMREKQSVLSLCHCNHIVVNCVHLRLPSVGWCFFFFVFEVEIRSFYKQEVEMEWKR